MGGGGRVVRGWWGVGDSKHWSESKLLGHALSTECILYLATTGFLLLPLSLLQHVMRFAEVTQEVVVDRPQTVQYVCSNVRLVVL